MDNWRGELNSWVMWANMPYQPDSDIRCELCGLTAIGASWVDSPTKGAIRVCQTCRTIYLANPTLDNFGYIAGYPKFKPIVR